MKRAIAALLAPVLIASLLCGCGEGKTAPAESTAQPVSEEVYVPAFQELRFPEGAEPSQWALADEAVFAAAYEKIAEGEVPEGKTPDYEGEYDVMGWRLYRIDAEGNVSKLDYEPLPAPEDTQERRSYSSHTELVKLFPDAEGVAALERQYESWYTGTAERPEQSEDYWDHVESRSAYTLRRLDAEGNEVSAVPLETEETEFYDFALDGEGRLCAQGEQGLTVFAADGRRLAQIDLGEGWIYNMARLPDGGLGVLLWRNGMSFMRVEAEKGELTPLGELKQIFPELLLDGRGANTLYYSYGTKLYGWHGEDGESELLLDWLDCDLSARQLRAVRVEEDGSIRAVWQQEGEAPALVTLKKAALDSLPQRQELTLGALYADMISEAVLRFNRSQDQVRIRVLDYSDYVNGEDYEAGLTKLSTEIMAGNMPDLLALDSLPYAQLAAKGLLEDLYPWLDGDAELKREDFFENVLKSMEVGGRLCQVTPGFSVVTLMGSADVVGDTPGWSYEDFQAALSAMPEGCTAMGPGIDRNMFLEMCSYVNMAEFLDWGSGTCRFDSEDFQKLLAFCKSFPDKNDVILEDDSSDMSRIAEGRQMLVFTGLYSMEDAVYNEQYFGGKSTYIGLPTADGRPGNVLMPSNGYAMSSKCADKEAAWRFLRGFLTEDYAKKLGSYEGGLPLNKKAFQAQLDKAMEIEYEKDTEGHYLLDANGERIPTSKGGMSMSMDGGAMMDFTLWAMTQEQADKLLAVIEGADRAVDMNTTVSGIIREEAAAYFAGQKSVEEVAKLIQSKVSLYVSEQR